MTDEQILQLAKSIGFGVESDERLSDGEQINYWECEEEQLLEFARVIYEEGYEQHRKDILGEELYYG